MDVTSEEEQGKSKNKNFFQMLLSDEENADDEYSLDITTNQRGEIHDGRNSDEKYNSSGDVLREDGDSIREREVDLGENSEEWDKLDNIIKNVKYKKDMEGQSENSGLRSVESLNSGQEVSVYNENNIAFSSHSSQFENSQVVKKKSNLKQPSSKKGKESLQKKVNYADLILEQKHIKHQPQKLSSQDDEDIISQIQMENDSYDSNAYLSNLEVHNYQKSINANSEGKTSHEQFNLDHNDGNVNSEIAASKVENASSEMIEYGDSPQSLVGNHGNQVEQEPLEVGRRQNQQKQDKRNVNHEQDILPPSSENAINSNSHLIHYPGNQDGGNLGKSDLTSGRKQISKNEKFGSDSAVRDEMVEKVVDDSVDSYCRGKNVDSQSRGESIDVPVVPEVSVIEVGKQNGSNIQHENNVQVRMDANSGNSKCDAPSSSNITPNSDSAKRSHQGGNKTGMTPQNVTNGTNRHEGHTCSREMRRLARVTEQEAGRGGEAGGNGMQAGSQPGGSKQDTLPVTGRLHSGGNLGNDGQDALSEFESDIDRSGSPFPEEAQGASPNTVAPESPAFPGGKKKRKRKAFDPFDDLPQIKNDEIPTGPVDKKEEKLKKKSSKKWFNVSQFDDPLRQLVWVIFRSADKDGNDKLNKKELSLVLNSAKLDLSFTAENIKQILLDCSNMEEEEKDHKTCEITFEEFLPLGQQLLTHYYSKMDENSIKNWCILDKGKDFGIIYFNKITGEASADIPMDYQGDMLKEPDLFEMALQDMLDTADINNDGLINITDFLNVIMNRDFGLFLTKTDIEEITKYFTSVRGKPAKLSFVQFLPLAKRLIIMVYKARDPTPHEWCHLYTRCLGSFWFNKRTGESNRHPPTSLVRAQQELLEFRSREIEVFMETAKNLDETREALEQETKRREQLEAELNDLKAIHHTTTKELHRTTALLEKSRDELDQKAKMVLYLEKEKSKKNQIIDKLQDRADEADKIDARMESMRNVLQNTQTSVKEKEYEVRELTSDLEDTKRRLTNSRDHAADLQDKIDELTMQLREEIRRNEKVEKELDNTIGFKSEKVEVEDILKETKDELQMRMNQLTHARIEIRENKARLRRLESDINDVPNLQEEIQRKDKEFVSLQEQFDKLKAEKEDVELRFSKYQGVSVRKKFRRSPRLLHCNINPSSPENAHSCSDPHCPINGFFTPQKAECSQVWAFSNNNDNHTPNGNFLELIQSMEEGEEEEDLNIYDMYEPQCPTGKGLTHPSRTRAGSAPNALTSRPKSSHGRMESQRDSGTPQFLYEDDYIMTKLLKEGDRVRVWKKGTTSLGMKPSDLRSATVRYIGQLDQEGKEHMLFAGLHLDDPVGNTSGVVDGKRYFYVKRKHGKMVRITDIMYIFNPKTTSFEKVCDMKEEFKSSRRPRRLFDQGDGPRLVKVT